jgi:uncharacterized membrane protein
VISIPRISPGALSEGGYVIKLRVTTVVNRPLEVVFAYLSDFMNLPEYEPWVEKVKATTAGPIGVGSTWHHTSADRGDGD